LDLVVAEQPAFAAEQYASHQTGDAVHFQTWSRERLGTGISLIFFFFFNGFATSTGQRGKSRAPAHR
jgi:hypothetical protein